MIRVSLAYLVVIPLGLVVWFLLFFLWKISIDGKRKIHRPPMKGDSVTEWPPTPAGTRQAAPPANNEAPDRRNSDITAPSRYPYQPVRFEQHVRQSGQS